MKRTCLMLTVASLVCACATPQNTVETYPGRELARPLEWGPLLEARYEHTFSGNKRTIKIVGAYIYVDCVPEELAAILEDLKPIVSQTNEAYRADLARQAAQRQKAETDAVAEKQRLEDVKKGLKFD